MTHHKALSFELERMVQSLLHTNLEKCYFKEKVRKRSLLFGASLLRLIRRNKRHSFARALRTWKQMNKLIRTMKWSKFYMKVTSAPMNQALVITSVLLQLAPFSLNEIVLQFYKKWVCKIQKKLLIEIFCFLQREFYKWVFLILRWFSIMKSTMRYKRKDGLKER